MKVIQLIILIFLTTLCGCASVVQTFDKGNAKKVRGNTVQESKIYSGVKKDGELVSLCFNVGHYAILVCPVSLLALIDLPFSLVADTLFLPYTIPQSTMPNQKNKESDDVANERLLIFDFVRNNEEVIQKTGGIKSMPRAEYLKFQPDGLPKRYEVSVDGYNGRNIYAIVGISGSQGDFKLNLECTTHIEHVSLIFRRDACAQ
jgi:uncharacterized protein YceK